MRRKHELVCGHPISCWDDGPNGSYDRYTVVYLDSQDKRGNVTYCAMSAAPFSPQGFGQHGTMPVHAVAYRGRGGAFRKRITFADLPPDCQKAVRDDLRP